MKISVIGTGYVGLVSGVCLAEKGHQVTCVDLDQQKVDHINNGESPIHEEGLYDLLKKNIHKNFTATTNLRQAVTETEISLIAVGTPYENGSIDLSSVKQAARQLGNILGDKESYHTVVVKSTVVPGTTDEVVTPILEEASGKRAGVHFGVGMNPEFLREGEAVSDFLNPDRIVLGGIDKQTREVLDELYRCFENVDKVKTNNRTAEMIKYTSNALLATLISFSNEIGNLCAATEEVDIEDVMKGVHKDNRFSPIMSNGERIKPGFISYLAAGCGFGGSCLPKDTKALISYGKQKGNDMKLLESVIDINEQQSEKVVALLEKHFEEFHELTVSILGLSFKPGTDDIRESPAIFLIDRLRERGTNIKVYDPVAHHQMQKVYDEDHIHYSNSLAESIEDTEALILVTAWEDFKELPTLVGSMESDPLFIDGRRMFSKNEFAKYEGIGLHKSSPVKKSLAYNKLEELT